MGEGKIIKSLSCDGTTVKLTCDGRVLGDDNGRKWSVDTTGIDDIFMFKINGHLGVCYLHNGGIYSLHGYRTDIDSIGNAWKVKDFCTTVDHQYALTHEGIIRFTNAERRYMLLSCTSNAIGLCIIGGKCTHYTRTSIDGAECQRINKIVRDWILFENGDLTRIDDRRVVLKNIVDVHICNDYCYAYNRFYDVYKLDSGIECLDDCTVMMMFY